MHGFVAADVVAVAEEAARLARQREWHAREIDAQPELEEMRQALLALELGCSASRVRTEVLVSEWEQATALVKPSGLLGLVGAITTERAHGWSDVGGLADVKVGLLSLQLIYGPISPHIQSGMPPLRVRSLLTRASRCTPQARLEQLIIWPLRAPGLCASLRLSGPQGVLLFGPPGTGSSLPVSSSCLPNLTELAHSSVPFTGRLAGKTLLVRALAAEAQLNLLAAPIPQLIKPEVGCMHAEPSATMPSNCPLLVPDTSSSHWFRHWR